MDRCPNCRARQGAGTTCPRCGMDLVILTAVERAVEQLTTRAVSCLAADDPAEATRALTQALGLRREPFAGLLMGFARQLETVPSKRPWEVGPAEAAALRRGDSASTDSGCDHEFDGLGLS